MEDKDMKCSVCGKTEVDIKVIIDKIIEQLEKSHSENKLKIAEITIEKMVEEYISKNAFTIQNKNIVNSIDNNIKEMGINAFFENKPSFVKLEPKLEILYNYVSTNRINIDKYQPIAKLIESFCNEPDEQKLNHIKNENKKFIDELEEQNNEIEEAVERLKNNDKYLFEKDISFKHYEIPNTRKIQYDSPYGYSSYSYDKTVDIEETIHKFCPEEYKTATKIILCPFCKAMFSEAAHGALNYMKAQQESYYDD
jgi:hypothetical protein